jgi:hypothetical protein
VLTLKMPGRPEIVVEAEEVDVERLALEQLSQP